MVSGYIKVESDGTVTVNYGLVYHTLTIAQLSKTLSLVDAINRQIEVDYDSFKEDPLGHIVKFNEMLMD